MSRVDLVENKNTLLSEELDLFLAEFGFENVPSSYFVSHWRGSRRVASSFFQHV